MLIYDIPGRPTIEIENIVFDYNGTIAENGRLIEGLEESINKLAETCKIYILTADTYGTVQEECKNINGQVLSFPKENAGQAKKDIVEQLGADKTLALGNGFNDIPMFQISALSIAVIQAEGLAGQLLTQADIVARSIKEALNIIANEDMIRATLRN